MSQPPIVPGPQQPPPQAPAAAQAQPVRRTSGPKVALIVAGCFAGLFAVCIGLNALYSLLWGGSSGADDPPAKPAGEVTVRVESCTGSSGIYKATVRVTNGTSRTRSPVVTVEFLNAAGVRIGRDVEFVSDLAPGQSSLEEAIASGAEDGPSRCRATL
jgi:hypothetical protein